jgi:hypothetical protein
MATFNYTKRKPDAPTNVVGEAGETGVNLVFDKIPDDETIEVWWNSANNRATATKYLEVQGGSTITDVYPIKGNNYYWMRRRGNWGGTSDWSHDTTDGLEVEYDGISPDVLGDDVGVALSLTTSSSTSTINNSTYNSYQELAYVSFSSSVDANSFVSFWLEYSWSSLSISTGTASVKVKFVLRNTTTSTDVWTSLDQDFAEFNSSGVVYGQKLFSGTKSFDIDNGDTYKFSIYVQKYRSDSGSTFTLSTAQGASVLAYASSLF